jgi:hypothetical protein
MMAGTAGMGLKWCRKGAGISPGPIWRYFAENVNFYLQPQPLFPGVQKAHWCVAGQL